MIKSTFIYLLSSVFNKLTPFIMLPVLTRILTAEEYGILAIFQVILSLSLAVSGLNININIPRRFFEISKSELGQHISNIYIILFFTCLALLFFIQIPFYFIDSLWGLPERWYQAMPLLAFMSMSNLLNLTLIRTREKPASYMAFEISHALINLVLSLLLIIVYNMGWEGRILGISVPLMLFGIVGVAYIIKQGYWKWLPDFSSIRELLMVSVPMIPHALALVVISVSDRLFIEQMVDLTAVGVYTVGYYFGMVVMLFTDAFIKAWSPWFYRKLASPTDENKKLIVKYTYLYFIALILGTIVYSTVAVILVPVIVGSEFIAASDYIVWICLGYLALGFYQIFFPYLIHTKKTNYIAISTVTAAIVNLIGNYFFILQFGAIGAAYSTIVAFAIAALMVFLFARYFYEMPWRAHTAPHGDFN